MLSARLQPRFLPQAGDCSWCANHPRMAHDVHLQRVGYTNAWRTHPLVSIVARHWSTDVRPRWSSRGRDVWLGRSPHRPCGVCGPFPWVTTHAERGQDWHSLDRHGDIEWTWQIMLKMRPAHCSLAAQKPW